MGFPFCCSDFISLVTAAEWFSFSSWFNNCVRGNYCFPVILNTGVWSLESKLFVQFLLLRVLLLLHTWKRDAVSDFLLFCESVYQVLAVSFAKQQPVFIKPQYLHTLPVSHIALFDMTSNKLSREQYELYSPSLLGVEIWQHWNVFMDNVQFAVLPSY